MRGSAQRPRCLKFFSGGVFTRLRRRSVVCCWLSSHHASTASDRGELSHRVTWQGFRRPSLFSAPSSIGSLGGEGLYDSGDFVLFRGGGGGSSSASQQFLLPNGTTELPLDSPAFQVLPGGLSGSPLFVPLPVVGEGWSYLLPPPAATLGFESSSLVVFSPLPPTVSPPLFLIGGDGGELPCFLRCLK
jgi:hypothetical protein